MTATLATVCIVKSMSRYSRYVYSFQKHFRTFTTVRSSGCIDCYRQVVSKRVAIIFPSQACCFSVKFPRTKTVSHSDKEKFSDSDSERESDDEYDNVITSVMKVGKPLSSLEWENVKTEAIAVMRGLNDYNIDGVIMLNCFKYKQLGIGVSYLEHLSNIGKKLNIATISHFLRLCYNCQNEGVDEQLILSLYDELHAKCPILDASTSEAVILGLSLTNRWKESIELIDTIKMTCSPGGLEYSALVKKAFDNDEVGIATKYLEDMLEIGRRPRPEVYLSWLDYLDRQSKGNKKECWKMMEDGVLCFLEENDQTPTVEVVNKLRECHQAAGTDHYAEFTSLTPRGVCKSCKKFLNPIRITKGEFDELRSVFLEKVVVGKDVFSKTTPEELENFKNFVKNTAPYDIVLDGLNIAYTNTKKHAPKNFGFALQQVVEHFSAKSQKILVLGRKHMKSWPKQHMNKVFKNAHVFLAQDVSQDDPFLLYAALYSGQGTDFVSRDLMRSHSFLLKNKTLRSTFKRWQLQHQYQIQYITQAGKVHLKPPLSFNPMVQRSGDGSWHIPYDAEFVPNPPQMFEAPTTWLCLTSAKKRQTRTKTST